MNTDNTITFILVRHGLVDNPENILYYRHVNVPLSNRGHEQMQTVGKNIKDNDFIPRYIYTSTLARAIESSKEIAKSFPAIQIIEEENLQDPYAPGIETKTNSWMSEIEERGLDVYSHPELIDVIEPRESVGERMKDVIDEIRRDHMGETVVVVSHGDPIALLIEKLRNPNKKLSSIAELKKSGKYPNKGEAWCIVLDSEGHILQEKVI